MTKTEVPLTVQLPHCSVTEWLLIPYSLLHLYDLFRLPSLISFEEPLLEFSTDPQIIFLYTLYNPNDRKRINSQESFLLSEFILLLCLLNVPSNLLLTLLPLN